MWHFCGIILLAGYILAPTAAYQLDKCRMSLGVTSGDVTDEQMTSSSSYDESNTGPQNARVNVDRAGGAWCPRPQIHPGVTEYLQIDLVHAHVLTSVLTQGRYGQGRGMEYTESYQLQYQRSSNGPAAPAANTGWLNYSQWNGDSLLPGNTDVNTVHENLLYPPIIANRVRLIPHSRHPRTVCLRIDLLGCRYTDGVVSYSMRDGSVFGAGDLQLTDRTYDGQRRLQYLYKGVGQLVDGVLGSEDVTADLGHGKGYEWIGWSNNNTEPYPIEITFEFATVRKFSSVKVFTGVDYQQGIQMFALARVFLSLDGRLYDGRPQLVYPPAARGAPYRQLVQLSLADRAARFVKLQLFHRLSWICVSEIEFVSEPCAEDVCVSSSSSGPGTVSTVPIPHDNVWKARPQDVRKILSVRQARDRHQQQQQLSQSQLGLAVGLGSCLVLLLLSMAAATVYWWSYRRKSAPLTYTTFTGPLGDRKVTISMRGVSDKISLRPFSQHLVRTKPDSCSTTTTTNSSSNTTGSTATGSTASRPQHHLPNSSPLPPQPPLPLLPVYRDHVPTLAQFAAVSSSRIEDHCFVGYATVDSAALASPRRSTGVGGRSERQSTDRVFTDRVSSDEDGAELDDRDDVKWKTDLLTEKSGESGFDSARRAGDKYTQLTITESTDTAGSSCDTSESIPYESRAVPVVSPAAPAAAAAAAAVHTGRRTTPKHGPASPGSPHAHPCASVGSSSGGSRSTSGRTVAGRNASPRHRKRHHSAKHTDSDKDCLVSLVEQTIGSTVDHVTGTSLTVERRLGDGEYGQLLQCQFDLGAERVTAVIKCIDQSLSVDQRERLCCSLRELTELRGHDHVCEALAVCTRPLAVLVRHSQLGDLNHYLQRHLSETSTSCGDILTYSQLIDMAQQIAEAMRFIHSKGILHRDLATRNCIVFSNEHIRISDTASGTELYAADYWHVERHIALPLRWLAWEVLYTGEFSTASDVWAFGVTLWEILTFAREVPYDLLTDDQVVANLGHFSRNNSSRPPHVLEKPVGCTAPLYQLMLDTWSRDVQHRPSFAEIVAFFCQS